MHNSGKEEEMARKEARRGGAPGNEEIATRNMGSMLEILEWGRRATTAPASR